jgi:hypothetical protein
MGWGVELCLVIAGPSQVRSDMLARMWASALHHTEMAGELAALWAAVSSTMELVVGCSPNETFRVEVANEMVAEFRRLEELCLQLEGTGMKICNLLLRSPLNQARWGDRLDEAAGQLEVELVAQRRVDAELEALQTLAARIQDLVLGDVDILSLLAASLSMVVEMLEAQIDIAGANGVRYGTRSALVATLSHFLELQTELELLRSGRIVDLTEDQADALSPLMSAASDSLASLIPSSVARDPPNDCNTSYYKNPNF